MSLKNSTPSCKMNCRFFGKKIEIDKFSERCEIIPGCSIQAESEVKILSQYYKNVFSNEDSFVFEGVQLHVII